MSARLKLRQPNEYRVSCPAALDLCFGAAIKPNVVFVYGVVVHDAKAWDFSRKPLSVAFSVPIADTQASGPHADVSRHLNTKLVQFCCFLRSYGVGHCQDQAVNAFTLDSGWRCMS
jgi:hypothetical protein